MKQVMPNRFRPRIPRGARKEAVQGAIGHVEGANHQAPTMAASREPEKAKLGGNEDEKAKALQTVQDSPEPNGLQFATAGLTAAPKIRKGNVLQVMANKTREEICDELCCEVDKAAGTQSIDAAVRVIDRMANSLVFPRPKGETETLIQAITSMAEYAPQNVIEANLVAQMNATNEAAMMFLWRATRQDQDTEVIDLNVARVRTLMRLHLDQIEALQKLRGKSGQQKVIVEHVNVQAGGQAIVGTVTTRPGVGDGTENR